MHKIWAVVRREFLDKVRTRAFLIGTLLFPLLMIGLSLLPLLLNRRETAPRRIAIVDGTKGEVGMKVTVTYQDTRVHWQNDREVHRRGNQDDSGDAVDPDQSGAGENASGTH